ncbi:uncharacterized protein LOC131456590 isoform X2 [Solea solea]|uniref:uncharacterized protein LOC131456590 isoform X2 n=1 Tax=Solea solea TaxID=90069 RepID=UPI002729D397|nr:uncharacterized protein LOC131456590 isoform X2 [Solea solea]
MEQTLLCVLGLFSLNLLLYCGQAQVVLTVEPNWSVFFLGESVTLICDGKEGQETDWWYLFNRDGQHLTEYSSNKKIQTYIRTGHYSCTCNQEESNKVHLTLSVYTPKAVILEGNSSTVGAVMLTCSVSPSTPGWEYSWYSGTNAQRLTAGGAIFHSNDRISVSQEGLYWCVGGRGTPRYYTKQSDTFVAITPVVKLNHNWPEVFYREKTRLTCEMKGGENVMWEYEWMKQQVVLPENKKEHVVVHATTSDYMCRARSIYGQTRWSKAFTLTVIDLPKLSVSSLWPNHGASVNLNCAAEHPSAGWRFYWYKLIPNIAREYIYDYELLPGSTNGTTKDSYVVYNHTNTAGYTCRAGRGDPVHYTSYSNPKFVWSREFQSPPSLRVSPDKVQHFRSDSVSLTCEGNSSTQWTVVKFRQDGFMSQRCSGFGTLTGSTCITELNDQHAVYWCESKSGQFSSAVNISTSREGILLESPAHPVAEGAAVTLRCKLKTGNFVADVFFYKNDKVVQNDTRWELTIPAVSESHEGFYRCEGKYSQQTLTSPQSWISVKSLSKPEHSPGHMPLIVGLVCGVLVIIPLLLLLLLVFCYRMSKENKETQSSEYASPQHDDACHYETVKPRVDTEDDEARGVVYSLIEIKKRHEINGEKSKPDKGCVYSDLKIRSDADDDQMYAQVQSCSKDKKNNKRKSTPAVAEETVYSEINPGKSSDQ